MVGYLAWCLTLYSGHGATFGLYGGAMLGKVLSSQPNTLLVLQEWETQMRPFIQKQHRLIPLKSQLFVPSNRVEFAIRWALISSGFVFKLHSLSAKRIERRIRLRNALF